MTERGLKARVFALLEPEPSDRGLERVFNLVLLGLIALNVVAVVLETVQDLAQRHAGLFRIFEAVSLSVFTLEYVGRLWACTARHRYADPVRGRLRFARTPLVVIDLLVILPFLLPFLVPLDLRLGRALRLVRVLRVLRLARYFRAFRTIGRVVRARKEELAVLMSLGLLVLLLASSLMYLLEHDAQPEAFASIPRALWWGVVTLTTVGYGDVYPVTPLGRLVGGVIQLVGIGLFALPAGILAAGFAEQLRRRRSETCPHCGRGLDGRGGLGG